MRFESPNVRKRLNDAGFQRLTASADDPQKMVKADCSISLENRLGAIPQGFESLPLRQRAVSAPNHRGVLQSAQLHIPMAEFRF